MDANHHHHGVLKMPSNTPPRRCTECGEPQHITSTTTDYPESGLDNVQLIGQVARELDLTESAVRNWVKQYEVDHGSNPSGALTTERNCARSGARCACCARSLKKSGGLLRQIVDSREKATYAVRRLCRVLAVRAGSWMHRLPSQRARDNDRLQVRIRAIHAASRGTYGSPRVHEQLTQEGCAVGRERVARAPHQHGDSETDHSWTRGQRSGSYGKNSG